VPMSNSSDDFIGIGGPGELHSIVIGLGEKAFDGGLEIDARAGYSALEPVLGQLGE
jgi:hypothetical protein